MTTKVLQRDMAVLEIGNVVIENISLVDGLKHNLLSVSQFTDKVYEVNFKSEQGIIVNKKDNKIALQGVRKGNTTSEVLRILNNKFYVFHFGVSYMLI